MHWPLVIIDDLTQCYYCWKLAWAWRFLLYYGCLWATTNASSLTGTHPAAGFPVLPSNISGFPCLTNKSQRWGSPLTFKFVPFHLTITTTKPQYIHLSPQLKLFIFTISKFERIQNLQRWESNSSPHSFLSWCSSSTAPPLLLKPHLQHLQVQPT